MNRVLFGIIGVLFIAALGVGGYALTHQNSASVPQRTDTSTSASGEGTAASGTAQQPASPSAASMNKAFTLTDVAAHASENDCYTAINGSVYDLTPFVNSHPGGVRNITKLCGKDGTRMFEAQHGGQARPEEELATLKIGILQ